MAEDFNCASCGAAVEGDQVTGISECRVCRRNYCSDCIDEDGRCVECADKEK